MEAIHEKIIRYSNGGSFLVLGFFAGSAKAETIVTTDVLNVRENPTVESKLVGKMLSGNKLDVVNTENGWTKIKLNGQEAFVSAEFTKKYILCNGGCVKCSRWSEY